MNQGIELMSPVSGTCMVRTVVGAGVMPDGLSKSWQPGVGAQGQKWSHRPVVRTKGECQSQWSGIGAQGQNWVTWSDKAGAGLEQSWEQAGTGVITAMGRCFEQLLNWCWA